MRRLIHRLSFVLGIVCVCMLPVGFVIDINQWGQTAEHHYSGYFVYAWLLAIINHLARPMPTSESRPSPSSSKSERSQ